MLKHIPTILSPELVKYLMEMGHGDEVVIADAKPLKNLNALLSMSRQKKLTWSSKRARELCTATSF